MFRVSNSVVQLSRNTSKSRAIHTLQVWVMGGRRHGRKSPAHRNPLQAWNRPECFALLALDAPVALPLAVSRRPLFLAPPQVCWGAHLLATKTARDLRLLLLRESPASFCLSSSPAYPSSSFISSCLSSSVPRCSLQHRRSVRGGHNQTCPAFGRSSPATAARPRHLAAPLGVLACGATAGVRRDRAAA